MLDTNLIGCRGKAKKDKKYNISKLKKENIIALNRLKNISYPQIRILLILSYFIKSFPTHFSLCKSVILCRCSNVKSLIEAGQTGPNSTSSFTTLQKGHSRFDGYSPLKLIFLSSISNLALLALKIIWAYLGSNSVRYVCGLL